MVLVPTRSPALASAGAVSAVIRLGAPKSDANVFICSIQTNVNTSAVLYLIVLLALACNCVVRYVETNLARVLFRFTLFYFYLFCLWIFSEFKCV